jgi:hypothetical protein
MRPKDTLKIATMLAPKEAKEYKEEGKRRQQSSIM